MAQGRWSALVIPLAVALVASFGFPNASATAGPARRGVTDGPQSCEASFDVVASPQPPASGILEDVAAISEDDVWAVGTDVEHWDGTAWSVVPSPNPFYLFGVTALGPDDVWAVGGDKDFRHSLIQHWDGNDWTAVSAPSPGTQTNYLTDVAALAPDDIWAVGFYVNTGDFWSKALMEHWDGVSWNIVSEPDVKGIALEGVAALSADDIWAVGAREEDTFTEHWDGVSWAIVSTPSPGTGPNALESVAALGPSDVWAVGYSAGNTRTLAEHWDGTAWTTVETPPAESGLFSLAAVSPGDVWATSIQAMYPLVEHWDGNEWSRVSEPVRDGVSQLRESGIGVLPTGEVWLVGYSTSPFTTLKERLCPMQVLDTGFSPESARAHRGLSVAWSIPATDTTSHTVVDATGLGLFDSGEHAPGTSFVFRFAAAGTYSVVDTVTSKTATISVPPDAIPVSGGTDTTYRITWASEGTPPGDVFDVQVLRPGAPDWVDWLTGVRATEHALVPDSGAGTYSFRARLRAVDGAASGWSPPVSISVS